MRCVASVNDISSLEDFAFCTALEELYLRKNNISDLTQLCHLQDLPNLTVLWLSENPCAQLPDYRATVLRILPNLKKLDNIGITTLTFCGKVHVLLHVLS